MIIFKNIYFHYTTSTLCTYMKHTLIDIHQITKLQCKYAINVIVISITLFNCVVLTLRLPLQLTILCYKILTYKPCLYILFCLEIHKPVSNVAASKAILEILHLWVIHECVICIMNWSIKSIKRRKIENPLITICILQMKILELMW